MKSRDGRGVNVAVGKALTAITQVHEYLRRI